MKKNIADNIRDQIHKHNLSMKPKWHYTLGAVAVGVGLTLLTLFAIFLIAISIFQIRFHSPFTFLAAGSAGVSPFLATLPLFPIFIALIAIVGGLVLMKRYEFSYKHAFWGITSGFLITIISVSIIVDAINLSTRAHAVKEFRPFFAESYANGTWVVGSVKEIKHPKIFIVTPKGENYVIVINDETEIKPPTDIQLQEWIHVVGEKEDMEFKATLIIHNKEPRGTKRLFNNHGYPYPPHK